MQVVSTLLVFQAIALLAGALPQQASTEVLRARSNEVDRFVASSLQDSKLRRDPGLFDDILSEVVPEGPVIDGCQVVPCATDLGSTGIACIPAIYAGGADIVDDLKCLLKVLKDVKKVPKDCAHCPQAIKAEIANYA